MQEIKSQNNIIEIKNISFYYGNNKVLDDITLSIAKGDYLGIIGPNGAGKTTLLKIVLGLISPSSGYVNIFGVNIKDFKDWSKIGYVPQKVTNFDENFPATVYDVALMGRYGTKGLFSRITKRDKELTKTTLEQVNMWQHKNRLISDLSGGEQQKVFIARELAKQPEIIFFDEPTVGIDQKTREEFYSLLKKLNKDMHLTVVLISHDIEMMVHEVKIIACIDRALVCHSLPEDFIKDTQSGKILGKGIKIIAHGHHH